MCVYVKLVDFDDGVGERVGLLGITLRCMWMFGALSEQRIILMPVSEVGLRSV